MAKLNRKVGATSQIFQIFIADSSSTTGAGLTGLAFNTSSLVAYYHRDTDTTATAITLVTMTVGTFTSSGFKEIDATNMPGWYQFCPPNAALASGAVSVGFHLKGAANMAPLPIEVDLDSQVDVTFWNGTVVATPATAGIPDVNVKNINNVAATSVTTVNANVGTTQPVNFTGTGASALAKSDMVDIAGAAVSTSSAQIGVNAVNIGGTAQTGRDIGASVLLSSGTGTGQLDFTSGVVKANATQWLGGTIPAVNVTGVPKVDVVDWLGTAPSTPTVAGVPNVNVKTWNDLTTVALPLVPTTAGRTLDVSAGGEAGVDWANVGSPTTTNGLTGTTISASQVVASVTGAVGSVTGAVGSVTGAVGSVTGNVGGNVTGSVGSVVGAVGSVTGNVGGNVVGSVASVVAGVTLAASAITAIWDKATSALTTAGSIGKLLVDNITASISSVAGAVWDIVLASHLTAGSTGAALNAAGAAGDPWSTAIPGAYGAGTAGFIVGTNVDAAISSRLAPAGTLATVTNLTNAPTSGDFTATMKTSLNAATPAVTVSDKTGFSLSTAGVAAIWNALTSGLTTAGSIGKLLVDNITASISSVAGAVWDIVLASHVTAGTTGKALSDASAAGDPWAVAVPGAYGAGTAGKILGTNLDALVSSRLAPAGTLARVTLADTTTTVTNDVGITQAGADKVLGSGSAVLPELTAVPAATPKPGQILMLMFQALRNKLTTSGSAKTIYNDAGSPLGAKVLSDNGTTYTEDKLA